MTISRAASGTFGDPQLRALEEQVSEANQNVEVAEARFRQARALIGYYRAGLFPTVLAGGQPSSLRDSTNRAYPPSSGAATQDFLLSGDVSYELDLWGRVRRSVTAAREETQATAADLETARLSLQAELAFNYFELRSSDAQQRLLNDTVKAATEEALNSRPTDSKAAPRRSPMSPRRGLDGNHAVGNRYRRATDSSNTRLPS